MIQICDIEVSRNLFLVGIKDYPTQDEIIIEVSERNEKGVDEFITWYNAINYSNNWLVTFNGMSYDEPVINYAYRVLLNSRDRDGNKLESIKDKLLSIHNYSQELIGRGKRSKKVVSSYKDLFGEIHNIYEEEDNEKYIDDPFYKAHRWTTVDLFRYWAKSIRLSKKISLKSLGIALEYPNVNDLPFDPNKDTEDIDKVIKYLHDDIRIPYKLMLALKEEINFRERFGKQEIYQILPDLDRKFNFLSYDAPKITTTVINYLLKDSIPLPSPKKVKLSDIILKEIEAPNICVKGTNINALQYMKDKVIRSTGDLSFSAEVNYQTNRLLLDFGLGGIHGMGRKGKIVAPKGHTILDIDIGSMYPSFIIEHNFCKFPDLPPILRLWRDKRFIYKKEGNTFLSDLFKLFLNGTYGMYGNKYSILYDLKSLLQVTVNGQMYILSLIDTLAQLGIEVFTCNTDGITMFVPDSRKEEIMNLVIEHGKRLKLVWEFAEYEVMYMRDVNNYLAKYSQSELNGKSKGKIKRKGVYEYNVSLVDSVDELVVPKVAESILFGNNKDIISLLQEELNKENGILKFCLSKKVSKDYDVLYNNQKVQNLNRFFVSRKGYYLYKKKTKGKKVTGKLNHIMKDNPVKIYNSFDDDTSNLDLIYYKNKVLDLLKPFEEEPIQFNLFT